MGYRGSKDTYYVPLTLQVPSGPFKGVLAMCVCVCVSLCRKFMA